MLVQLHHENEATAEFTFISQFEMNEENKIDPLDKIKELSATHPLPKGDNWKWALIAESSPYFVRTKAGE